MKGIVSFDMDMTLLNHADYKIPDSAIKALDLLRKNYYIVIATGRDMDAKFSEGLADQVKPDAIIHLNGNKITIGPELIYEHCMKRELVEELLHFAEGKDYAIGMTVGDIDYFVNPWCVTRHDMVRWQMSDRKFRDPWKLLDMPVRTLAYIGREPGAKEVEAAFPMLKLPLFSSREGADIIEKDASKAEGLKRLCKAWNIPLKNTIAFGDSMNDKEMLETAGLSICMKNGNAVLKTVADDICPSVVDDGIYRAFEKYELL